MATIGTFTKSADGFSGAVRALTLNVKATIRPAERENDKAPDYRIYAGAIEFGAAWKKDLECGPRLPFGQARRPELPGSDLRLAGRDRGREHSCPDLVPTALPAYRIARFRRCSSQSAKTWSLRERC